MMDSVEENKINQGNEKKQEDDEEVVLESTNVNSNVDVVNSLLVHDSDTPTNLNSLPRMVIRSIPSSKNISRKRGE